jgi:hypothetical protein
VSGNQDKERGKEKGDGTGRAGTASQEDQRCLDREQAHCRSGRTGDHILHELMLPRQEQVVYPVLPGEKVRGRLKRRERSFPAKKAAS